MTLLIRGLRSPRNSIPFDRVPTVRGPFYGTRVVVHHERDYGPILDSVYEMAIAVRDANGISASEALHEVLVVSPEWRVLPRHQKDIVRLMEEAQ